MVVGGVPEVTDDHAQRVARFALDMMVAAKRVNSPSSGKPLQVTLVSIQILQTGM